jgi:soluble lytic murein transglycosylase-like protein
VKSFDRPRLTGSLAFAFALVTAAGSAQATGTESCFEPAAAFHQVNPDVLRAICKVESGLNPRAIGKNDNGSIDVGICQINSSHFKMLATHGVAPNDLLDACKGIYVGAWFLSQSIARHGNTWEAIARYHSRTPYFNQRYQALIWNELLRAGVVKGKRLPVPPLRPHGSTSPAARTSAAQAQAPTVVFDQRQ